MYSAGECHVRGCKVDTCSAFYFTRMPSSRRPSGAASSGCEAILSDAAGERGTDKRTSPGPRRNPLLDIDLYARGAHDAIALHPARLGYVEKGENKPHPF